MRIGTRRTVRSLALCVLALAAGCGTIISKAQPNRTSGAARTDNIGHVYTGVRCDAQYVRSIGRGGWNIPLGIGAVADMPVSLLEDTLFLLVDLPMLSSDPWNAADACGQRDR